MTSEVAPMRALTHEEIDAVAGGNRAIRMVPAPSTGTVPWFGVVFFPDPSNGQDLPPPITR
jgi:hypothetical protein